LRSTRRRKKNFAVRNRIVVWTAARVVVFEGAQYSVPLITARCPMDSGRESFWRAM